MALFPVLALLSGASASSPANAALSSDERSTALLEGEAVYAFHCAVCHGRSGGGLTEARLAFPPDSRHCTRCHKPNNRVVMPLSLPIIDNDMFSIGDPPALHRLPPVEPGSEVAASTTHHGAAPMPSVAAPDALFAYVRATMPRYEPARLSDSQYWLITAFLLAMNDRTEAATHAVHEAMVAGWSAEKP